MVGFADLVNFTSLVRRMTERQLDISTVEGKRGFVRNLVAYNIILEGIWFYSGFMVALPESQGEERTWGTAGEGASAPWRRRPASRA